MAGPLPEVSGNPPELRQGVAHPDRDNSLRLLVLDEGVDMVTKRRVLVVDHRVFGNGSERAGNRYSERRIEKDAEPPQSTGETPVPPGRPAGPAYARRREAKRHPASLRLAGPALPRCAHTVLGTSFPETLTTELGSWARHGHATPFGVRRFIAAFF